MTTISPPKDYSEYLMLDQLLSSQVRWSGKVGAPAHDEMLFIVIHQAYELWFKQVIFELDSVIEMFDRDFIDENSIGVAVSRLVRTIEIMKVLVDQVRILETMTPLDFLDFRSMLGSTSGFQSKQFRQLEERLGLRDRQPNLFRVVEKWLERTPFLALDGFHFVEEYKTAVHGLWKRDLAGVESNPNLTEEDRTRRLDQLKGQEASFLKLLDPEEHKAMISDKKWHLSYPATIAALFINLYRDEPILHLPYRLLSALIDLEENFNLWRHRHSLMVLRMIGTKMGTGGSAGHDYLRSTVEANKVFTDLFNLSSLLISRSDLPTLPAHIRQKLSFHYSVSAENG